MLCSQPELEGREQMESRILLGAVIGLVTAVAIFEFQEWRRRCIARANLKQAVVAELELLEATLATVPMGEIGVRDEFLLNEAERLRF